ncbi:pectin lyase-like protein [Choiromyces venosus 120613-1]|uniref:Pectin lyase-like protein n=1 Tax=Choiromyces venosus 120613-1 TaxID=1336337 RepID=A0A3N4K3F9_9PEZI|nr:pectin lyase-like protein [Choiromyces venosus 120613-1]
MKHASTTEAANGGYATLNGGTTGGIGGSTVTATTLAALTSAAAGDTAKIILVSGTITGNAVAAVGSNKSILGKTGSIALVGINLRVNSKNNVIIRNLKISKVLADTGDAIGIQAAKNVRVDHVDLFSDMGHDKASLVGHSDSNSAEDKGHPTITYKHNYWKNINSGTPSIRFDTGHIYNNYFLTVNDGINTRQGAQVLVQNNVFEDTGDALYSTDAGYAVATGKDFDDSGNTALVGAISSVPYSYSPTATASTKAYVIANAGAILTF